MNTIYDMLDYGSDTNYPGKVVIHSMGEYINNNGDVYFARDWLEFLKLSAHYLIKPDGDVVVCRADTQGAWHARGHNTNSIGIEFLVEGTHDYASFIEMIKTDWCRTLQYAAGIEIINNLQHDFGKLMVVRHSDISPGRKIDPGKGFNWDFFKQTL